MGAISEMNRDQESLTGNIAGRQGVLTSTTISPTPRRLWLLLVVALLLTLGGGLLAAYVQTAGGTVEVRDVRWVGTNGTMMSGLLYVPSGVTNKNPAPGIVAIPGYINSRETQDGFAIEFARRGYVVLAADQTGHGYSDPPAFANGFGGPDALAYLRSLDIVDKNNIGLEGHSMGGWAVLIAANVYSDSYRSIVLEGSSTGTFGAPAGTSSFPRNLGLVFSKYDEFSQLMWNSPTAQGIVNSPKLQAVFGISDTIQVGRLYGSIADGTARKLYQPAVTHPGDHISTEAIGDAIEWMQATLQGGKPIPPSDQIWYWKEIGTLIALIGAVLFLFPMGALLLQVPFFASLRQSPNDGTGAGMSGVGWWVGALLMLAIPGLTLFPFEHLAGDHLTPNALWPQSITNAVMVWAVGNALITLVLFLIWHFASSRSRGATWADYGLTWRGIGLDWRRIGKSCLLAIALGVGFYTLLVISDFAFKTDFRFWVVAVKVPSPLQFRIFLSYLIPFIIYFLVVAMALHGQMRGSGAKSGRPSLARAMFVNVVLMIGGIVLLLLYQYIPLLLGGTLGNPAEPLWSIIAYQFVALLAIAALVSTYFFYKTGHIYVGAFLNALLITQIIVAGTATHYPL